MKSTRSCLLASCMVLALVSCGGTGEERGDESSDPAPPPAPPTPTPTPPSNNRPPEANAGEDRSTVEEQDVTVDGSRTRDPDDDALTYTWQLTSAPDGSRASVNADTPTFVFRPDLPGTYQLRLTASDGRSSSADTMRVTAQALLAFDDSVTFKIKIDDHNKGKETRRELELKTSSLYRGEPVAYTATSDVPWLRVLQPAGTSAAPGGTVSIPVELVMDEVRRLPSGDHETPVVATPTGGWEQAIGAVTLELEQEEGERNSIVPYVAYTGQPSDVALYGDGLLDADGDSVFINGVEISELRANSNERATIELPPLPAGAYTVRIGTSGDLSREMGRIVVRDEPVHRTAELALPGLTRSLEYDAERDAFYAVFVAPDGTRIAQRLHNTGSGEWLSDTIPVHAPWAVALTADGAHLLVTSDACTIHRLEPQTLGVLQSLTKASCDPDAERLGAIAALADGRVLVVDDVGDSGVWEYPDFTPLQILPRTALFVLNGDRDRLLWAGGPHGGRSLGIAIYDVAASGDAFDSLGGLSEIESSLDQRGNRAVALDFSANTLLAFRASSARSVLPMPADVQPGSRAFISPSGAAAFAFALTGPAEPQYRLYVRELNERL